MLKAIWQSAVISAFIASVIFTLCRIGEWIAPQYFRTPVDWFLLGFLFAVGFVPRLIMVGVDALIAWQRRQRKRRRKT